MVYKLQITKQKLICVPDRPLATPQGTYETYCDPGTSPNMENGCQHQQNME